MVQESQNYDFEISFGHLCCVWPMKKKKKLVVLLKKVQICIKKPREANKMTFPHDYKPWLLISYKNLRFSILKVLNEPKAFYLDYIRKSRILEKLQFPHEARCGLGLGFGGNGLLSGYISLGSETASLNTFSTMDGIGWSAATIDGIENGQIIWGSRIGSERDSTQHRKEERI